MSNNEATMDGLYNKWCIAQFEADCLYDELGEDFTHPRFARANRRSQRLLLAFLGQRTASLRHVLLKLHIACEVEIIWLRPAIQPIPISRHML